MMHRQACFASCLLVLAVGSVQTQAAAVTPVEKVIELLEKLGKQVEQEGQAEAAEYDKYACFCKDEASDKLYAIEKSKARIEKLDAKIEQLAADIAALNGEIQALGQEIDRLAADMAQAKKAREDEHAVFATNLADVVGAVSACERALQALKESKAGMGGKTEMEAFAQVKAVATMALKGSVVLPAEVLQEVRALVAAGQPGKAYESSYHSNDIIGVIEALQKKFEQRKAVLEQAEFDSNSAFEKRQLGLSNEKKFAEKDRAEKEALVAERSEEKAASEADLAQETNEMGADQNFLDVLTADCETKASLWDQRSRTRAAEVTAIAEAMEALRTGVAPNYQANKKLVGLQTSAAAAAAAPAVAGPAPRGGAAASFLQLRRGGLRGSPGRRISQMLLQAAERLKSPVLSAAAVKVSVAQDHFVKVRGIIKDLVKQLQEEADAERTQKSFCDAAMAAAVEQRDAQQNKKETLKAEISAKEAAKAQLQEEIATLTQEVADNKKALMEASDLRGAESAENLKTIAEAQAGQEAVNQALGFLKTFYEGAAFAQFVPANSGRDGKTLEDKAPKVFDSEYNGSQEASKGIVGLLEVVLSDFERTVTQVTEDEANAAQAFTKFKEENEADTLSKEAAVTTKEGEVTNIEDALVTLTDDLRSAEEQHRLALEELEKLHSMCVAGEETYEERVAKRKQEIEALKEAHDMLENWQQ